ncbi:MAG: DegT/DnrJ/EryC1/StrS family aminotransferase [Chloroflexi bacterium]|nr:DegT/DnrJ/EryC1/StrS family aminotransferase [Chloroflexota bacterium]
MANIPLVDLKAQYLSIQDEVQAAIGHILDTTRFVGGKPLTDFEEAFATYQNTAHCVGVGSGTSALMMALAALGIGPGDEVLCPTHTFIASIASIKHVGAEPVFVDIDPATYNIDPALLEERITGNTKAIMPVHLYGQMADMTAIMAIAEKHNLKVIEDAAQAHGAAWDGRRAGEFGDVACFSFYPGKNLGAYGEGGAVVTDDAALADLLLKMRDHGRINKYEHDMFAFNERLHTLQAAILNVKLAHLDEWNDRRRHWANVYDELLTGVPGVVTPTVAEQAVHVYHIYCIRVPGDRDAIRQALNDAGIGAGIHYPINVHLQPAMQGYARGDYPHSEEAAATILSLPIYAELTQEQVETVVETLKRVLQPAVS